MAWVKLFNLTISIVKRLMIELHSNGEYNNSAQRGKLFGNKINESKSILHLTIVSCYATCIHLYRSIERAITQQLHNPNEHPYKRYCVYLKRRQHIVYYMRRVWFVYFFVDRNKTKDEQRPKRVRMMLAQKKS